jgi:hypothetical protein
LATEAGLDFIIRETPRAAFNINGAMFLFPSRNPPFASSIVAAAAAAVTDTG